MPKLYKALLLLIIVVAFNACKKDDSPVNLIVGKWKMTGYHLVQAKGDEIKFSSDSPPPDSLYIAYFQNGKGIASYPDQEDKSFTYTVKNSKLSYTPAVSGDFNPITYDILNLTKTELKLYYAAFESDSDPNVETRITITYTKVK